jgi:DNA-binding protein H-NS
MKTMVRKPFKLGTLSVAELTQLRDEVQTALSGKIQTERQELQQKLEELGALETGRGTRRRKTRSMRATASNAGGRRPRKRSPVYIRYYDPETGQTYSNRGPMAKWLRGKREAGENIDKKYLVSASNPLPKKLAHLTPPA